MVVLILQPSVNRGLNMQLPLSKEFFFLLLICFVRLFLLKLWKIIKIMINNKDDGNDMFEPVLE